MKLSPRNVSIMVVAAVLVSAGAVGLLIRQACRKSQPPADAAQDVRQQQRTVSPQRLGGKDTRETSADRRKRQEWRAQELKKMASLTEEEKARFRAQIREQFSGRASRAAQAEREKALLAQAATGPGSVPYPEPRPAAPADANAAQKDAGTTIEPNQAGQH